MEERPPRKRISFEPKGVRAIVDESAYSKNRCSNRARKIKAINSNLTFEVWHDQHLQIRQQFGDDNGERKGIETEKIESLVSRSMKHLIAYSSILKTVTFINHNLAGQRAIRVVLQEPTEEGMLNVVIEVHWVNINTYEITVITAMRDDAFGISDGQFVLELNDPQSILKKMEVGGRIKDIYDL